MRKKSLCQHPAKDSSSPHLKFQVNTLISPHSFKNVWNDCRPDPISSSREGILTTTLKPGRQDRSLNETSEGCPIQLRTRHQQDRNALKEFLPFRCVYGHHIATFLVSVASHATEESLKIESMLNMRQNENTGKLITGDLKKQLTASAQCN